MVNNNENQGGDEKIRSILLSADIAAQTGQGEKALKLLEEIKVAELPPALQAGYYGIKGEAHFRAQQYKEARPALEKALELHRQPEVGTASPLQIAQLRNILAGSFYMQNLHKEAYEQHKICLEAVCSGIISEKRFKLKLFTNLGNDLMCLGNPTKALSFYEEAVEVAEDGEDDMDRANSYWGVGITLRQLERYSEARKYLENALKLYQKQEAWQYVPGIRNTLGWVLISLEEYEQAKTVLEKGLEEALNRTHNRHDQALIHLNLAYLYFVQQQVETALPDGLKAVELAREAKNKQTLGLCLAQLAEIKLALGAGAEEGKQLFNEALTELKQIDSDEYTRRVYKRYSEALKKAGYIDEAFEALDESFRYFHKD
ncbi:MAG TPA: tetratricopeptide repeat protein [Chloroflexia bacterium]|nr:tetratricopeptide repeat protein [Chloroflexia bacterium]